MSDGNLKVPSQVFRWFEKMKSNYENSVQAVLSRFETYNLQQQARLDNANEEHISNLKQAHKSQQLQSQNNIEQLHKDIEYYKQQIDRQQSTIEQLNTRYDAVMACLLNEKNNSIDVKNIFDSNDFFSTNESELLTPNNIEEQAVSTNDEQKLPPIEKMQEQAPSFSNVSNQDNDAPPLQQSDDELFDQAVEFRNLDNFVQAFELFEQAANNSHARSMGAMGRSYFLGEGVEENQEVGLAWLIRAAKLELPQAVTRVKHFKENEPELYQQAEILAEQSF